MNYGQFLNMVPEFYLVCILLVVFFMDFFFSRKSGRDHEVFGGVTIGLMLPQKPLVACMSLRRLPTS